MRRFATLAVLCASLGWAGRAGAYRPFDGTDADVATTGEIEVELGPVGYRRAGRVPSLVAPAVILNWGAMPGVELVLEGKNAVVWEPDAPPRARLVDPALDVKWLLRRGYLQGRPGASLAVEAGALMPSSEERGAGGAILFLLSQPWGPIQTHLNLEAALERDHRPGMVAGVIVEGPERWRSRPVSELVIDRGGGVTGGSALIGWIWPVGDAVAIDSAVKVGYHEAIEGELRLGVTFAFSILGEGASHGESQTARWMRARPRSAGGVGGGGGAWGAGVLAPFGHPGG